jgi:beta-glucosidase
MEQEAIVLLENKDATLPLSPSSGKTYAFIGPHADRVSFGDYVFYNATLNGISPLAGVKQHLSSVNGGATIKYAEGSKLWSNDQSGFAEAVDAARDADAAVVFVGTWSLDQTLLWTPGTNATTGEHVDVSDLALVGAQLALVQAVSEVAKKTVVVFVSGKPVAEPWIKNRSYHRYQRFARS